MFDWLVDSFANAPYPTVAVVFMVCGLGFPLPEEIVLVTAGYVCFKGLASLTPMILTCSGAILLGDLVPFTLGRVFGSRLLRLRTLRILVNRRRLALFDRWFRRRGDLVIFFARFLTGLRIVAYFTAGTMKMSFVRFIALDLIGIALVVPLLVGIGYSSGHIIDEAIDKVQQVERGILIAAVIAGLSLIGWYWLRRRRKHLTPRPSDTFVGPTIRPGTTPAKPEPKAPDQGDGPNPG